MAEQAVEGLAFPVEKKKYIVDVLDPLLEQMVHALLKETPSKPIPFMMNWLKQKQGGTLPEGASKMSLVETNEAMKKHLSHMKGFVEEAAQAAGTKTNDDDKSSDEEEDDDEGEDMPMPPPPVNRGPRQSVSAEAYGNWNQVKEFTPPVHAKTTEQAERLQKILSVSFLFSSLEKKDLEIVVKAMIEQKFDEKQRIITEGEDGNHLYVIESGSPVCLKKIDGEEKVVKECKPGDVFGELALLYNAPRAASVEATDACTAWQLDRETFNHIVQSSNTKSRQTHDGFLQHVSLFQKMDNYERSQICDALKAENYKKDDFVVKENEQGHTFYIIEEGTLQAEKGEGNVVLSYASGDYFGELALLKNQPRAASVRVTSPEAKVLSLDRQAFVNLLGPVKEILARQEDTYKKAS